MKKKLLGLALAVVSCFALTACGSDEGKELQDVNLAKYLQLGEYTGVEISPQLEEVAEADVEAGVENLYMSQYVGEGITDRTVKNGDITFIHFAGYKDDVAFEGGTGETYLKIGSGTFIPGFEEGLIGAVTGEEIELPLTFPEDYHSADLAGQAVVFKVTVDYILPELTDEIVDSFGNEEYKTVDALEAYVRTALQEEVDDNNYDTIVRLAMQKIIANTTFKEVPQYLIEQQKTILEGQLATTLQGTNIDVETYLTVFYGTSLEALAEANVKERMVIQAIANEAGIEITDEELEAELESIAVNYGVTNDQILAMMETDRAYYREYMYGVEVYEYVYQNTVVTEAE